MNYYLENGINLTESVLKTCSGFQHFPPQQRKSSLPQSLNHLKDSPSKQTSKWENQISVIIQKSKEFVKIDLLSLIVPKRKK